MLRRNRIEPLATRLVILGSLCLAPLVSAQVDELAPVALDDSPAAELALDEARSQAGDNPERTAELAAELLDQYASRVVENAGLPEVFESVRSSVIDLLRSDPGVLAAWRRAESSRASSMLERDGRVVTFQRRPLTSAGLEAGFRIAQMAIESGRPEAGLRTLDSLGDWPGAEREEQRFQLLQALALIDLARRPGSDDSIAIERDAMIDLVAARSPARGDALARLRDRLVRGEVAPGVASVEGLERLEWTPLWDVELGDGLFLRKTTNISTGQVLSPASQRRAFEGGSYLVSIPVVHEDLVLVNEGFLIEALDRYTGRLVWYRDHGLARGITPTGIPGDLNEILLADGEAYTVLGHFFSSGSRGGDGSVVRFDPSSGLDRWSIRPDRMDDDPQLEGADPAGPPVVVGDLLVLPLRKATARLETIDMVLAVDRVDGAFRWLRTIASSGKMRSNSGRPLSRVAELDGDVLVATAAGAIARLEGATGDISWLRRDEVPLRMSFNASFAWQIGTPVVCDRGVAIIDAARRHWVLLDPETGELLLRRPIGAGTIAGAASWLMVLPGGESDADLLMAIGTNDVVAIDPASPDERVWGLRRRFAETGLPFGTQLMSGVRGRVFPIEDGLVVPVVDRLYVVDGRTGTPSALLDMPGPSNPIVTSDAIYAVGSRSVMASMPINDAIAALEARIRATPDAIPQALALMELSERNGRAELLVFAARSAVEAALRRGDTRWNGEVLDRILEVLGRTGPEEGGILLELAGGIAEGSTARAKLELVRGDWLVEIGRRAAAAEAWMAVFGDDEVGAVRVPIDGVLEGVASVAADARLRTLLEDDPQLRAELDRRGRAAMDKAIRDRVPAADLVKLARRHSGTDAAILGGLRALEILRDEGQPRLAAFVAMKISRDFPVDHPGRRELLARAIESLRESNRPDLAEPLVRLSGSMSNDGMDLGTRERRPVLDGVPDRIEILEGFPTPIAPEVAALAPTDGIAMTEGTSVVWRTGKDLEPLWTVPLESPDATIVGFEPLLLVWEGRDRRDPRLTAIDPRDGTTRWSTPRITELLPPPGRLDLPLDGFLPDGLPFLPHQVLARQVGDDFLLVRRDGSASLVDGTDGRSVRWSSDRLMTRIYGMQLAGGMLHLSGSEVDSRGEVVGVTVSLDPMTGRRLHRSIHETGEVRLAVGDDTGRLAVITKGGVSMVDPVGAVLGQPGGWTSRDPLISYASFGWIVENNLVLVDEEGLARTLMADLGQERVGVWGDPPDGDQAPGRLLEAVRLGDRWLFRHASRLFLYDRFGTIVGADGIARRDLENVAVVPISDGLLLVSRNAQQRLHRIYRLDQDRGLFAVGTPFDHAGASRFDHVTAVDGWLLLRRAGKTHALPMSSSVDAVGDP
ncbi:MAG: PQQ-binding-like beta-propeller repeat protein [Phycisphaera sp.]|nr:PQQ-binding-like beta-propeller repeat protein [Phycisphaera sp.]